MTTEEESAISRLDARIDALSERVTDLAAHVTACRKGIRADVVKAVGACVLSCVTAIVGSCSRPAASPADCGRLEGAARSECFETAFGKR